MLRWCRQSGVYSIGEIRERKKGQSASVLERGWELWVHVLRSWLGPWCVECFSISLLSLLSSTVHTDYSLPQRSRTHTHTHNKQHTHTHTRHAHSQIGSCAVVQAVTRRWTDAGVTISIGLRVGNNTLAGFSHETALTREATLKWSIHYLQITPCSCVCMCMFVFVRVHAPITCYREPVCTAGKQWVGITAIINSEIKCSHLRSQVQICFLFFLACYNEAPVQNTMQTSMLEHLLQSLGCFVFPLFYGSFLLLVYFGLPQPC